MSNHLVRIRTRETNISMARWVTDKKDCSISVSTHRDVLSTSTIVMLSN